VSKFIRNVNFNRRLALILFLYVALAVGYSVVVPIGQGADEWAHYWYAQFIAENGRLPVSVAERKTAGYKSDWPPLYHLLAAGLTGWIETDGPPTFKYRADNLRRQIVAPFGPEAILHTEDELFPWQQEILIWHLGRFLSILFSTSTLVITYFIAIEVITAFQSATIDFRIETHRSKIQNPKSLALAAVALLAFNPRFLFTGMLFNYDSLTLLLASLFLWLAVRVAKGYYARWGFWVLGALAGLALMTKYLTVLLPLEIVLVAAILGLREQDAPASSFIRSLTTSALWIRLGQASLAYLLVISWWFGYLIVNFNEIDTYGPVLGTLAPLIRGDSSDRTVAEIFVWLSGGQAPPPDYIEQQSYTAWQIVSELPTTFWGNPIIRPYPLNWFVLMMTVVAVIAVVGIIILWRTARSARPWLSLLILPCALPLPFMIIRLFGARDALEAVQGRHILFLAGPAVAILLVWGLSVVIYAVSRRLAWRFRPALHFTYFLLLGLLLTGAVGQLILMKNSYPSLLPVRTTPYAGPGTARSSEVTLPGGASLSGYNVTPGAAALKVALIWQSGHKPAPEDYQVELALIDPAGQIRANWQAYQTQAHYPTRVWEKGDTVRDEGWLPLTGLPAGEYEIRLRILGQRENIVDWQTLTTYTFDHLAGQPATGSAWTLWRNGEIASRPPLLTERETVQFTYDVQAGEPQLIGPDGVTRSPVSAGSGWANFIIRPDWPAGDYYYNAAVFDGSPLLRVVENERSFQVPEMEHPLEVNFEDNIRLLGYDLPSRRVEPGDSLPIILYWQGLQWLAEDFVIFSRLLDNPQDYGQQAAWGGYDRLARENYSTLFWAPGEVVTDGFAVPVDPNTPPGVYTLSLGWYRQVEGQAQSLPILNPETGELTGATAVTIGPIKVGGPPEELTVDQATPETEVNVLLGEQIELLGFDLARPETDDSAAEKSDPLRLTFYWQALNPMDADYTVFVHLRNEAGETVAQKDSPPANGAYPTSLWDAGEIIKDNVDLPLSQLDPGRYHLMVGMYDFETGIRLPVTGSVDSAISLADVEVTAK
jgi:hypothetical protein